MPLPLSSPGHPCAHSRVPMHTSLNLWRQVSMPHGGPCGRQVCTCAVTTAQGVSKVTASGGTYLADASASSEPASAQPKSRARRGSGRAPEAAPISRDSEPRKLRQQPAVRARSASSRGQDNAEDSPLVTTTRGRGRRMAAAIVAAAAATGAVAAASTSRSQQAASEGPATEQPATPASRRRRAAAPSSAAVSAPQQDAGTAAEQRGTQAHTSAADSPAQAPAVEPAPRSFPADPKDEANHLSDQAFLSSLRHRATETQQSTLSDIATALQDLLAGPTLSSAGSPSPAHGYCARLHYTMYGDEADPQGTYQGSGSPDGEGEQQEAAGGAGGRETSGDPGASGQAYVPEVELVSEAVDLALGFKLPPKAYYGNRGRDLATMTVEQVKAQCKLWAAVCGPNYAQQFLSREPRLLMTRPEVLLETLDMAQQTLGFGTGAEGVGATVEWSLRNSSLLVQGLDKARLERCLKELETVLVLDRTRAQVALRRWTMLLTFAPGDLSARFQVLSALLPVDAAKLRAVVRKRPQLLCRSPTSLARALASLAALVKVPLSSAAMMLAAQIGLCGVSTERLLQRWRRLVALTDLYAPWSSQLAAMSPQQVARCLAAPEANVSRLAFVVKYNLQELPAAQDMKRLLTLSQASFERELRSVARRAWEEQRAQYGAASGRATTRTLGSRRSRPAAGVSSGARA